MARTAFKLRSQGQPFKQIGATQPVQPPQQDPVQPLYSNPSDPQVQQQQAQMQQQRAPLMQSLDPDKVVKNNQEYKDATSGPKEEEDAGADKTKKKSKLGGILKGIGLGAVDMLTAGLDRVYSTGKTNTLGGSKALTFAKTKAELAEQAKKDEEAAKKASITDIV
jgi:hypothetical protein